jgi:hypothetical protein
MSANNFHNVNASKVYSCEIEDEWAMDGDVGDAIIKKELVDVTDSGHSHTTEVL